LSAEQTKLDFGRVRREQSEIYAKAGLGRATRVWRPLSQATARHTGAWIALSPNSSGTCYVIPLCATRERGSRSFGSAPLHLLPVISRAREAQPRVPPGAVALTSRPALSRISCRVAMWWRAAPTCSASTSGLRH
jgi:hypothetical protein